MKKDLEERKKEYEEKISQLMAKNNKELIKEAERKEAERKKREDERKKKEDDDATKAIAMVVENVNASESEAQTIGGKGTKRGKKTTATKKKTILSITMDEELQKKLHNISDSYNPRRSTRSIVKVQQNVCAEVVSKEEFEGKDVSGVTSKVTNTPKKRKAVEKEDEDEPLDVEIIKIKKQKGVEKKAPVKGRILPLRSALKRNKKNDIEEVKEEQKTGITFNIVQSFFKERSFGYHKMLFLFG
ncbi:vicilin-like seed storage protein At2g18540 [Spinacia oleracea]|uniref:Vicilin-like seed storage protein At2g18540 n=1 Tax=Spinacia oleracea TaxID=3562 RepID=A0ABM3QYD8_SPIOL|nr:vicilin-like seed storage protein At2g18540 [Spinacia oleracea]